MLKLYSSPARLAALLALNLLVAAPALAQARYAESPGTALSRYIRVLASSPRDFNSLIGAGRASLELGDVQAAAGFFGRAEEANPNAPAAKAGLGAAMAHMGDADGAIFYFNQASRLGAQPMTLALDRGMARDLMGDIAGAQADYRLAISTMASDEARRRLALSLAIGRDRQGALNSIQPLLNRRDPAAQRTRAFVLALVGDQAGAAQAIEAVMPGNAARFAPFFRHLPHLSIPEKAAAVHLGIFPENASARVIQAQPQTQVAARTTPPLGQGGPATTSASSTGSKPVTAPSQPVRIAALEPSPAPPPAAAPSFSLPTAGAAASPSFSLPSATSATPTESNTAPTPAEPDLKTPALAAVEAEEERLSGIDKLLATIAEAPPPPSRAKVETRSASATQANRGAKAAAEKAAEKKRRDAKLAAEKKAKEEAAKLGVKGTNWVQLAGGSNQNRMGTEYKRLSGKAGKLLKSRSAYVTEGRDYFRLLVGPFDSKGDAQAFVNKLAKEGVDGFSWTRTPAKIKIEKLSPK
jgi:Flp pilus assembly protein TadD